MVSQKDRRDRQRVPCPNGCGRDKLPIAKLCRMCSNRAVTLTDEQRAMVVRERESGTTWTALAKRLHISEMTLRQHVGPAGATAHRRPDFRPLTEDPEQLRRLCDDYRAGASVKQLVDTYGGGEKSVRSYLVRQGVPIRKAGGSRAAASRLVAA